jgi:hypothetical protein
MTPATHHLADRTVTVTGAVSDSADCDGSAAGAPLGSSLSDELVREGARRLAEALRAEVDAYCARFADERDENGRRLVVRNGYHEPRGDQRGRGGRARAAGQR